RTNVVRLTKGRAIVAVKRPPMTDRTILRLRLQPLGEGLLGQDFWLRKVEDVMGVWIRDPKGGASYEVAASKVTNDFEVSVYCPKTYNMFTRPDEPLELSVRYRNDGKTPRKVKLGCCVYDWDGKTVFKEEHEINCLGGDVRPGRVVFETEEERGIYFAEAYVTDVESGRELAFARTNLVKLPPHEFKSTPEDSLFGISSYWDVPSIEDMQRLMDRFGIRWVRSGDQRVQHPGRVVNYHNNHGNWRNCMWPEKNRDSWVRAQMEYCAVHGGRNFEFGNEMNLAVATIGVATDGIGKCHFASNYVSWVKSFDRVMKENGYDQDVGLLGFGMAGFDHAFATRMREGGILPMLKGFCIHPPTSQFTPDYPYEHPERTKGPHPGDYPTVGSDAGGYWNCLGSIRAARDFLDKYAPGMPLWVTEMYSPSKANFIWGASMRDGASNAVLEYALMKAEGVKVGMFWQMCDGRGHDRFGINSDDLEYHFGLLNRDLSLKPSAMGYCAIAEALDRAEFAGWMKMMDEKTHGLLFRTPRGPMAVLWARWDGLLATFADRDGVCRHKEPWLNRWSTRKAVALPAKGDVTHIDEIGRARKILSADGEAKVTLSGSPCIVYGLDSDRIGVW
ncbi:MAG: hypothetical protein KBT68_09975, partial [bacterium]|nr:hypothetical protein [Candidatus Colisoma equi]